MYQEFVTKAKELLQKELGELAVVREVKTLKNNGVERVGLTISTSHSKFSPTIYLEEFYAKYQHGDSFEEIIEEISRLYDEVKDGHPWQIEEIKDFNLMHSKIVYKLINKKRNEKLLEKLPHIPYLDLAIVFYILYEVHEEETATINVTIDLMMLWDTNVEEIYRLAKENTPKLLPATFKKMISVIEELTDYKYEMETDDFMFVLTNSLKNFGASCILYDNQLQEIGERLGENYYILPSSIHETIIVPKSKSPAYLEELNDMVKEINETQLDVEEILSDNVYYYDRDTKELK